MPFNIFVYSPCLKSIEYSEQLISSLYKRYNSEISVSSSNVEIPVNTTSNKLLNADLILLLISKNWTDPIESKKLFRKDGPLYQLVTTILKTHKETLLVSISPDVAINRKKLTRKLDYIASFQLVDSTQLIFDRIDTQIFFEKHSNINDNPSIIQIGEKNISIDKIYIERWAKFYSDEQQKKAWSKNFSQVRDKLKIKDIPDSTISQVLPEWESTPTHTRKQIITRINIILGNRQKNKRTPEYLAENLEFPISYYLNNDTNLIIEAKAQQGKSLLLQYIAYIYSRSSKKTKKIAWLNRYSYKIPYIIDLQRLSPYKNLDLFRFISSKLKPKGIIQLENNPAHWSKILVLLDNLDSLPDPQKNHILQQIDIHSKKFDGFKCIITSRSLNLSNLYIGQYTTFKALKLSYLTQSDSIKLATKIVRQDKDRNTKERVAQLVKDLERRNFRDWLEELNYNPFIITSIAIEGSRKVIEQNISLYQIIKNWLEDSIEHDNISNGFFPENFDAQKKTKDILKKIAFKIDQESIQNIHHTEIRHLTYNNIESKYPLRPRIHYIISFLLYSNSILDNNNGKYKFKHLLIQRYLLALELVTLAKEDISILKRILFRNASHNDYDHKRQLRSFFIYEFGELKYLYEKFQQELEIQDAPNVAYEFARSINQIGARDSSALEIRPKLQKKLVQILSNTKNVEDRIKIANEIGKLGNDPRLVKPWKEIPRHASANQEPTILIPRTSICTPEFFISRWPVTQTEFHRFADSSNYNNEEFLVRRMVGKPNVIGDLSIENIRRSRRICYPTYQ